MKKCILCKGDLSKLFTIENMPSSAQDIPALEELESDKPITVSLCQCRACSLIQLDSEAVYYYKDVIRASSISSTMRELRLKQYKHFAKKYNLHSKKIIEIGCGGGEFLELWKEVGVEAYGTEHKKELVEKARKAGLLVEEDFPEGKEHKFKAAPFAAFCSFNFLEHQPDPLAYLRAAAYNLEEGGYGLITVPSFEYILENKSFYEIIPDHIAYYTFESLELALNLAGFKVLEKEMINRDTLSFIVKKKSLVNVEEIKNQKEVISSEILSFVQACKKEGKTLAIWGASHQGFTLCATLGLNEFVEYIIDSAKFKQGLYAPASHIKIIAPEDAYKNPVDVIIIVAPGYTKEISAIIRRNFTTPVEIYSLMTDRLMKCD